MTVPHLPAMPIATQQVPDSAEATIAVPAAAHSATATESAHGARQGLNGLLAVLVVVLAFLAASFAARNSDLWFHLATGRLIAQGQYSPGTDPFAYTTEHVYWANHAWLFDLALFGFYKLAGGSGLVVL